MAEQKWTCEYVEQVADVYAQLSEATDGVSPDLLFEKTLRIVEYTNALQGWAKKEDTADVAGQA